MRPMQPGFLEREQLQDRNRSSINQASSQRSNGSITRNTSTNEEQNSNRFRFISKKIDSKYICKNSIAINNPETSKTRAETEDRTLRQDNSLPSQFRSSDQTSTNRERAMPNHLRTPQRKRIYLKEEPRANILNQIQNFQRKPLEGTERKRENQLQFVSQYKPSEDSSTQGQMLNRQKQQLSLQNIHEDQSTTILPENEPEVIEEVRMQSQKMNFTPLFKLFNIHAKIPPHELKKAIQIFFQIEIKKIIGNCTQLSSSCAFSIRDSKGLEEDIQIKQKEIEILSEILKLFREHAKKEEVLHYWDENFKKTSQKIWTYLYQGYHNRFQDYLAHYLQKTTREGTNNHITSQHPDRVLTRIEELTKIWKPQDSIWQKVKNTNFEETPKKKIKKRQNVNISYPNLEFQDELSLSDMAKTQKIVNDQPTFILKDNKRWKFTTDLNKTRDKWRSNQVREHTALSKIFRTQHRVITRFKLSSSSTLNEERTTYQKQPLTVLFTFTIFWYSDKNRTFIFQEQFNKKNSLELHGDPSFEDIQRELIFQLKLDYCSTIKPYASIEIASVERTQDSRQYKVHFDIAQNVIDLPEGYSWTVASWKNNSLVASSLVISNQNGSAEWIEDVNLKGVNFSQENFDIGDRQLKCEIRELNKPCLVTFNGLPDNLLTSRSQRSIRLFQDFVMKMGPVELVEISFEKNTFTVKFGIFSFERNEKQQYDSKLPETATKSRKLCQQ